MTVTDSRQWGATVEIPVASTPDFGSSLVSLNDSFSWDRVPILLGNSVSPDSTRSAQLPSGWNISVDDVGLKGWSWAILDEWGDRVALVTEKSEENPEIILQWDGAIEVPVKLPLAGHPFKASFRELAQQLEAAETEVKSASEQWTEDDEIDFLSGMLNEKTAKPARDRLIQARQAVRECGRAIQKECLFRGEASARAWDSALIRILDHPPIKDDMFRSIWRKAGGKILEACELWGIKSTELLDHEARTPEERESLVVLAKGLERVQKSLGVQQVRIAGIEPTGIGLS